MKLTTTEGVEYQVTESDRLWLLRAVEAEGEPREGVASALVARFLYLLRASPGAYPTLAEFVRAYSQPVNPRWARGGDKWEKARSRYSLRDQRKIEERREQHARRTQFSRATRAAVDRALRGQRLAVETDFAAASPENRERVADFLELVRPGRSWRRGGPPAENDLFRARAVPRGFGWVSSVPETVIQRGFSAVSAAVLVFVGFLLWGKGDGDKES